MAIPDYQSVMLPLLTLASDNEEHSAREAVEALATEFGLTDEERRKLLPSGRQPLFYNRVGWARTYMKKAGLLKSSRRGYFQITERGLDVLQQNPPRIDTASLKRYPEFVEFQAPGHTKGDVADVPDTGEPETPEEGIEAAYQRVRIGLATDLLEAVKNQPPAFFERVVIDLLVKMGYGGTRKDAGEAVGGTGDGGIDGIIKEDRLGLDIVFIQAKRWQGNVSRPEIQKFAGALQGQRARKGIFITSSGFTQAARDYVSRIDSKIVLVDGETLAELMIDYNIGVTTVASYDLKRIDSDYFADE